MARSNTSDSSSSSGSSSNSSSETTTVQTCLYFCDVEQQNQTTTSKTPPTTTTKGFCPEACLAICPSICLSSLSSLISPPSLSPPQPNNPHNLSPLLISMLIILASVFLLITFYLLYTKLQSHNPQTRPYNNNNNPLDHEDHGGPTVVFHPIWYIPTVGLSSALINSIPLRKHSPSATYATLDCAVCLAEFHDGEELRVLPKCDHAFHVACIDTWLRSHTNCPLCRAPVIAPPPPPPDQTALNSSSAEQQSAASAATGSAGARDGGDLRIQIIARSASMNCVDDNKASGGSGCGGGCGGGGGDGGCCSSSDSSFVSRSMSCSAKIFCSRYNYNNNRPGPNS